MAGQSRTYDVQQNKEYEFHFRDVVEDKVLRLILDEYANTDVEFCEYLQRKKYKPEKIIKDITDETKGLLSMRTLYDKFQPVWSYFDDWILIKSNEDDTEIADIIIKKKTEPHIETCNW